MVQEVSAANSVSVAQRQDSLNNLQVTPAAVFNEFTGFLSVSENLHLPQAPSAEVVFNYPNSIQEYLVNNNKEGSIQYFVDQLQRFNQLTTILQEPANSDAPGFVRHMCSILNGGINPVTKVEYSRLDKSVAFALLATNIATLPAHEKEQCQATLEYIRNLHKLEKLAEHVSSNFTKDLTLAVFQSNPGLESAVNNLMLHIIEADKNLSINSISMRHRVSTLDIVRERVSAFYKAGMPSSDKLGTILAFTLLSRTNNLDYFNLAYSAYNLDLSGVDSKVNRNFLAREATDQKSHIDFIYLLNPTHKEQANLLLTLSRVYSQKSNTQLNYEPSREVKEDVQLAVMHVFVKAVEFDPNVAQVSGLKQTVWQQFIHRGRFYAKSGLLADKLLHDVTPKQDIEAVRNGSYLARAIKLADLQGLTGSKRLMEIGKLLMSPWMIVSVKNRLEQ